MMIRQQTAQHELAPRYRPRAPRHHGKTAIKEGGLSRPQDLRMEWELHQNDRRDSLHHQFVRMAGGGVRENLEREGISLL